ncbi:lysosomal alpha-glucosidase [Cephus cinctus]|uniref:Lysosomal alpha-glucosidase n=1 Tax=Cephus cinctus TaxID=211228 RepID=A0AAJ7FSW9_CEPCN|nr:lysosomal alpha-glucosidase [Cephus cinctus]XP_015606639.1 lysosomal alpha-glucosidase [Cephus cinctus]XP_024946284.1 lysosomal alpha-glucosidase [Cephus cinctus]
MNMDSRQVKEMDKLLVYLKPVRLRDRIFLSPYVKYVFPTILIALTVPLAAYGLLFAPLVKDKTGNVTCHIYSSYFVECAPGRNLTYDECVISGCCYNVLTNVCHHSLPSRHGYIVSSMSDSGASLTPRKTHSPFGSVNRDAVSLEIQSIDANHLEIILSMGDSTTRSSVDSKKRNFFQNFSKRDERLTEETLNVMPRNSESRTIAVELDSVSNLIPYVHYPEFSVSIARASSSVNDSTYIWTTARGPLILTESYWEWSIFMTNSTVYGLNDVQLNGTTNFIYNNENGTIIPAFLGITENGDGMACYVDYEGPMEIKMNNGSNLIILRGFSLPEMISVHIFAGPTPLDAVRQLGTSFSHMSQTPKGMSHGLHVCPNGDLTPLEDIILDLNNTILITEVIKVPWDSHCLHQKLCPTIELNLTDDALKKINLGREILSSTNRSFQPHLSPMLFHGNASLSSHLGSERLLLTDNNTQIYNGLYLASPVVYPDWANSRVPSTAESYLLNYIKELRTDLIYVRDSWPKDEQGMDFDGSSMGFDYMPQPLRDLMCNMTVPFDLISSTSSVHHTRHNSYSRSFRNFIQSNATVLELRGIAGEAGNSSWASLRKAIRVGVGSGLVGLLPPPMYVCGTGTHAVYLEADLCVRWYGAAVPWPHVMVLPERLPGSSYLPTAASLNAAKLLRLRATLATYQHTNLAKYYREGTPVMASTSLYYPKEPEVRDSWDQFMWGESILIGLVTLPEVYQVTMWIPGQYTWRHLQGGSPVTSSNCSTSVTAAIGEIVSLLRPGHVVPVHETVADTTLGTMRNDLDLLVNLLCDNECLAFGSIFYGEEEKGGDFLKIGTTNSSFTLENILSVQNYACDRTQAQSTFIRSVQILGTESHRINQNLCNLTEDTYEIIF